MHFGLVPLNCLIPAVAPWLNRRQQAAIDYLIDENRLLKARLDGRRVMFSDAECRRLAVRAKALGRKALIEIETLVSPDTLLRWHRQLVAQKGNTANRRKVGRPRTKDELVSVVVRMSTENPRWGYTRIQGVLKNLRIELSRATIANILKEQGIDPAPQRGERTGWPVFLKAHWKLLVASDFFAVEVWRLHGLTTYYVLFCIELRSRIVSIAGVTTNPDERWMLQTGRNFLDAEVGMGSTPRVILFDRDKKYCAAFRELLTDAWHTVIRLPRRSPNLNEYAERFVGSIKAECVNRLIFFSEAALRRALLEFAEHYHCERNHQGLGNELIAANDCRFLRKPKVIGRQQRLGGMLDYHYREAA